MNYANLKAKKLVAELVANWWQTKIFTPKNNPKMQIGTNNQNPQTQVGQAFANLR